MQSIVQSIGVMGVTVSLITGIAFAVRGYEYFSSQNTNVFLKTIYMMSWTYMSFVLGFVTTVSLPLVMMFVVFNMDKLNIIIKGLPSNSMTDHVHDVDDVHDTEADDNETNEDTQDDDDETHETAETEVSNTSSNETTDHSDQVNDVQQTESGKTEEHSVSEETPLIEKSSSEVSLTQTEISTDKTVEIKQELQNILETMSKSSSSNDTEENS